MEDLLIQTNTEVQEVLDFIEINMSSNPNCKIREYWNKIEHHYIHYSENFKSGKMELTEKAIS